MVGKRRLVAKKSKIEGFGLFTTYDINAGELICNLQGEIITIPELKRRYSKGIERICDPIQVSERLYLDLDKPYVYLNHSCEPNAAIVKDVTLMALKHIKRNEEITFDYSTTEWTCDKFGGDFKEWDMDCNCGTSKCRGIVTQFSLLPQKVRMYYHARSALQDFILRKSVKSLS